MYAAKKLFPKSKPKATSSRKVLSAKDGEHHTHVVYSLVIHKNQYLFAATGHSKFIYGCHLKSCVGKGAKAPKGCLFQEIARERLDKLPAYSLATNAKHGLCIGSKKIFFYAAILTGSKISLKKNVKFDISKISLHGDNYILLTRVKGKMTDSGSSRMPCNYYSVLYRTMGLKWKSKLLCKVKEKSVRVVSVLGLPKRSNQVDR